MLFMCFSEEPDDSHNEDTPGDTKEPTHCDAQDNKETEPDRDSLSTSGE